MDTIHYLKTKQEIFSAMVVYGFLSYENGNVSIPNRELMGKYEEMLQKESSLGYVYRLSKESMHMLHATRYFGIIPRYRGSVVKLQ